jgi:hypothetical protein
LPETVALDTSEFKGDDEQVGTFSHSSSWGEDVEGVARSREYPCLLQTRLAAVDSVESVDEAAGAPAGPVSRLRVDRVEPLRHAPDQRRPHAKQQPTTTLSLIAEPFADSKSFHAAGISFTGFFFCETPPSRYPSSGSRPGERAGE